MKLATLKSSRRNGYLLLVSPDLQRAVDAADIAVDLQTALNSWSMVEIALWERYQELIMDRCENAFPFKAHQCHSPLPYAYQWICGNSYLNYLELTYQARGTDMPNTFRKAPPMYQGGSDNFLAPYDDILLHDEAWGLDLQAEIAVVTDNVPMGIAASDALAHIKLVMLANNIVLRNLMTDEQTNGFGFFQSKPPGSFSPVAVTPDELSDWDGKVHHRLRSKINGTLFGKPRADQDMTFDFPRLIAHAARTRPLGAGTIIGSGPVSNKDASKGSSCLEAARMLEILDGGKAQTPYLKAGDRIRIEMFDDHEQSIFGTIYQRVEERDDD